MSLNNYTGLEKITDKICNSIQNNKVSHAYIFEADHTIDKVSFAKDFVKAVLCSDAPGIGCDQCVNCRKIDHDNYEDLYFIKSDGLSVKKDEIVELQRDLKNKPSGGDRNIAIICDADLMTETAQNKLLKTLEEPSKGTIIILLSENTNNLLSTINSRCIIYRLGDFVDEHENPLDDIAGEILELIQKKAYFADLKKLTDSKIKNKTDGVNLLDGLEKHLHKCLLDVGNHNFTNEKIVKNVRHIEKARLDLMANVNYKYTIRNLILKLGGK